MTSEEMEKLADMIAARLMDTFAARMDMIEEVVFSGTGGNKIAGSLTDQYVMDLKPNPEKQYVEWDTELKGYGVRVSPGGAKAFFVQSRIRGEKKETKVAIGRFGQTLTAATARLEAINALDLMRRGIDPHSQYQPDGMSITQTSKTSISESDAESFFKDANDRATMFCKNISGFYLFKLKRGCSWRYRYPAETGERKTATIGSYPLMSAMEAADIAASLKSKKDLF